MDEHVEPSEDQVAADHGRGAGLRRRIIIATVWAVVVRLPAWMFSLFIAGPVLGAVTFAVLNESSLGNGTPVLVEAVLTILALATAINIAVGIRRDEPRYMGRARMFGWVLAAETVFYVGSFVVVLLVWGGSSNLADSAWTIIVAGLFNAPLVVLGVSIARRATQTGPPPTQTPSHSASAL